MKKLSELIREYRESHYMSLRDFARKADVSHATIDKIEREDGSPSLDVLHKISTAMNISFIIAPNEPLKFLDAFAEGSDRLQSMPYDEEDMQYLNDPTSQPYVLLSKYIKKYGLDSEITRDFAKILGIIKYENK